MRSLQIEDSSQVEDAITLSLDLVGEHRYGGQTLRTEDSEWRVTLDLSTRAVIDGGTGEVGAVNVIGIDSHRVLSDANGDWGTLVLQGYLTRLDDLSPPDPSFEHEDDWDFQFRIFNFNYTALAGGRLNLRVGHFEVPYGLEQSLDTNGTIRQYTNGRNLGLKADWGVSVNGVHDDLEYEIGVTRGSGQEYSSRGSPIVVAARVGSLRWRSLNVGVSAFYGDVQTATQPDHVVRRSRLGSDIQWDAGPWTLRGELSIGEDEHDAVINALGEVQWQRPDESLLIYVQGRAYFQDFSTGWEDSLATGLGIRYRPDSHWDYSAQWLQNITNFNDGRRDGVFSLQIRYRF